MKVPICSLDDVTRLIYVQSSSDVMGYIAEKLKNFPIHQFSVSPSGLLKWDSLLVQGNAIGRECVLKAEDVVIDDHVTVSKVQGLQCLLANLLLANPVALISTQGDFLLCY